MLKTSFLHGLVLAIVCSAAFGSAAEAADGPLRSTLVVRPARTAPAAPIPLPRVETPVADADPYYEPDRRADTPAVAEPSDSEMVTVVHQGNAAHRYPAAQCCSHRSGCSRCRATCSRVTWRDHMQARWAEKKACLQYSHWGYPEEFEERPLGEPICAHLKVQATNGLLADMALYRYDFSSVPGCDKSQLNAHGMRRLGELARRFQCDMYPLVIEASPCNPELDELRRAHVIAALQECVGEVPDEWVVVGYPKYSTLSDEEQVEVYGNMLLNTAGRGSQAKTITNQSVAPNMPLLPPQGH